MSVREVRLGHAANCSALGNVLNVLLWSQVVAGAVWAAAESWQARRRRAEPGGETRLTERPSALVRTRGEEGEGDAGESAGSGDARAAGGPGVARPREAHLQITQACGLPCVSCHMPTSGSGAHTPLPVLRSRLDELAGEGVLRVALGGGEPLRHPDLAAIAEHARSLGLAVGVTTSGVGPERDLSAFDQVNVSLDALGLGFVRSRGYDGAEGALDTVRSLAARGTTVGINVVLDRDNFDSVDATVAAAVAAGATDIQLLRLKPVGRALANYTQRRLTPEQALSVWPLVQRLMARHPGVLVRLDCASVPFLAAHGLDVERMRAFGFRGCFGASELVSVDTAGARHPCSFAPDQAAPAQPAPARPAPARPAPAQAASWHDGVQTGPCGTCSYQSICKGGCHAVAEALTGQRFVSDPECPRVLAWSGPSSPAEAAPA